MATLLNLHDLLHHEIEDLYSAEEQIIAALPKMIEKASDRQLKEVLDAHLKVTEEQKARLDKVKTLLKGDAEESEVRKGFFERLFGGGTRCKGTEGLIREGEKMMREDMDAKVMDAAIIASAQKIEHYEISGYGTAKAYATELGLTEIAFLLETTLHEEYKADSDLTSLALGKVNVEAGSADKTSGSERTGGVAAKKTPAKKTAPKKAAAKKASAKKAPAKKA